jgi:hypothetical protein
MSVVCLDSTIIALAVFWFVVIIAAVNGAAGLVIFLAIKFFVGLNQARRGRA